MWPFNRPKPEVLMLAKEADGGIMTYQSPQIFRASPAHKKQLLEFINQIKAQIEDSKK